MTGFARVLRNSSANAAVEMALVLPLLLVLLFSSIEAANYFYNEHILVKAVRDGARYAARQDIAYFTSCTGAPGGTVVTDTANLVKNGLITGGTPRFPVTAATITVNTSCTTSAGTTQVGGIYNAVTNSSGANVGAPVVTVAASIPYTPIISAFGFTGRGFLLNASQQAAVTGW